LNKKGKIELTRQSSRDSELVDISGTNKGKEGRDMLLSVTNTFLSAKWANRFLQSAIIQGALITLLTVLFISIQLLLSSNINIIQFLSLSFEGPAKWIFLGYIFYMILIVAIATTAVFYNHFEVTMRVRIEGFRSILAWIHLLGMNMGGATVTLTIAYAGLLGSGIIGTILSGGDITELKSNTQIMEQFIIPISVFAAVLVIGLITGGLTFLLNYLGYRKKRLNTKTKSDK
jgi:hypothetical protein